MEEQIREQKAANLKPVEPEKAERIYNRVLANPLVEGFLAPTSGWTAQFGGLYSGSGFAIGPKYTKRGLVRENLDIGFSAVGSLKEYYTISAGARLRHLFEDRVILEGDIRRVYAPRVEYYGPGNNSSEESITNFRYENVETRSLLGIRPFRRVLTMGVFSGWSRNNVGPGQDGGSPSTETVFSPATTPGIDRQTDYLYSGPFVTIDTRDAPADPHKGSAFGAAYSWHQGLSLDQYSFRRMRVAYEQYFPFFNEKRVIAIMALGQFNYTDPGRAVPFYQQFTLGGPDDLRGFPRFRFYDNNSLIANAEYRWEISPGFDAAIFADAGKVMSKPGHLALSELHGSGGFGLRFKSRAATAMRIDVGFSPDGVKFWWTFSGLQRDFQKLLF